MVQEIKSTLIDRQIIDELFTHSIISVQAKEEAIKLLEKPLDWRLVVERCLFFTGISLMVAGIAYYTLANWDQISLLLRLGAVEGCIFLSLCGAYLLGFANFSSKLFLLVASLMIGVFLLLTTMGYQTGTGIYPIFLSWAGLILPLAITAEFAPLWGVFWLLINISYVCYFLENESIIANLPWPVPYLMLLNSLFLGLREFLVSKKIQGLHSLWTCYILLGTILFYNFLFACVVIGDPHFVIQHKLFFQVVLIVIYCILYVGYRFISPDITAIAMIIVSLFFINEIFMLKKLSSLQSANIFWSTFGLTTLICGIGIIMCLQIIIRQMRGKNVISVS